MIIHSTTLDTMDKVIAIYGGTTWVRLDDKFLVGAGTSYAINSTGGEATHTILENELPSHTHNIPALSGTAAATTSSFKLGGFQTSSGGTNTTLSNATNTGSYASGSYLGWSYTVTNKHTHTVTTVSNTSGSTGSGDAMSIIPPYKAVYIWERTE